MLDFIVDETLCDRCDRCVEDCVMRVIERRDGGYPSIIEEEAGDCFACQHCLAVCPTGAISIHGRKPADSLPLEPGLLPSLDAMERLVRGRRTCRNYRDESVDPALITRLLAALANAPTGVNRRELCFRVIDSHEAMERFRGSAMAELREAIEADDIPEPLRPAVGRFCQAYYEEGRDLVFRGAPHLLLVSAPPDAPCPNEDVVLALAYFELLANSAGLGTTWCGLVSLILTARPQLKSLLGLPDDHVHYQMLFGNPAFGYARTVQRDDGAQVCRIEL
jgi:nitroreductase/NAD-dependent dihydropyrimidine dehydrogenase PreA subunit